MNTERLHQTPTTRPPAEPSNVGDTNDGSARRTAAQEHAAVARQAFQDCIRGVNAVEEIARRRNNSGQ